MRIERAPYVDEYREGERSAVMLEDGRVLAVSPLVTSILESLGSESCSISELTARLVQTASSSAYAHDEGVLERTVHILMAEGLLREAVT